MFLLNKAKNIYNGQYSYRKQIVLHFDQKTTTQGQIKSNLLILNETKFKCHAVLKCSTSDTMIVATLSSNINQSSSQSTKV